ncbi:calpain-A-like isoform X2 [Physella acuta]|uniref:calpain-A-like isoform X2 n=1 Tax=Physella acuta TaxID=109671 RepID=UPI0027DC407F|nr:calpain-A-like isoform X2 [Physella acuta]XP_059139506.1 calpain-A-like isoform X2 [Physella acuta]
MGCNSSHLTYYPTSKDRDVPIKRVDSQKILVYLQQPVYYFQNKSTLDTAVRNSYNSPRGSNLVESDYTGYTIASDATFVHATDEKYDYIVNLLPPGQLFEDLEFPANNASLFFDTNDPAASKIVWLRPFEIVGPNERPLFIKEGVSRADIMQGILGDCWFLSSCAAIAKRSKLINKIIPSYQVLYGPKYRGMVHFRFWRYGGWLQVIIDDRLPTEKGKLIYGHCTDPTEFWVPLIEKAYAKLHGTYEALGGGITMDAMVDLTGGLAERYDLAEFDSFLFRRIYRAHKTGAFIACSRKGDWRMATAADENGLVPGHAYTVTNIAMVRHRLGDERLIRVRNPWGDATEWKGSWNDKDVNWQWVDPDTRDNLLEHSSPGEFWMSFRDFFRQFGEVTICLLGPDLDGDGVPEHAGHIEIIRGEWKLGYSAGGSRNNLQKFITNDQYLLTIIEPDDFDSSMDDAESEGRCNVVIALMQQHRKPRRNIKIPNYQIGFFVYETEYRTRKLPLNFFRYNPDYGKTKIFVNYREVSERFEFEPGHYIIIPTTFLEDCPAQFMLRVFGEKRFHLRGPLSRN